MGYTRNESKGGFKSSKNRPVGSESEGDFRGAEGRDPCNAHYDPQLCRSKTATNSYSRADGQPEVKPIGEIKPNVEESGGINIWQIAAMGLVVVGAFTLIKTLK